MILFPNAKLNLGLNITSRRPDGYHNIETVMIPIKWCDILEIVPASGDTTTLSISGREVKCDPEKNLVMKAFKALELETGSLPPADIYLHKIIPDGAGMGGGSADATFTLTGLNEVFNLNLSKEKLASIAAKIGADCPFFIYNQPSFCTGTGTDIDTDIELNLSGYTILIVKPQVASISTAAAYAGIIPHPDGISPAEIIRRPLTEWKDSLINDFESSIFPHCPILKEIKDSMYSHGAIYASMTGSGAAIYGIFDNAKLAQSAQATFANCDTFVCGA